MNIRFAPQKNEPWSSRSVCSSYFSCFISNSKLWWPRSFIFRAYLWPSPAASSCFGFMVKIGFSISLWSLFQMHAIHLSVAVWVGFLALFGIAANDGVIMGTYIHQVFEKQKPSTAEGVRRAVLEAGKKRVRPAMMTAAVAV